MRIGVARHNGLGDIIMLMPFVMYWMEQGHEVTLYTHHKHHEWLYRSVPGLQFSDCDMNPYEDFRTTHPRHDKFVNLNRLELWDDCAVALGTRPMNWQSMINVVACTQGLPAIHDRTLLSPSRWPLHKMTRPKEFKSPILFTKSTHQSRCLGPNTIAGIQKMHPDIVVDPQFNSTFEFAVAVHDASFIIGTDAGAVHVGEMMGTPTLCLHSAFDLETRHLYYRHVWTINAENHKTCYRHGGCDVCRDGLDSWDMPLIAGYTQMMTIGRS